MCVYAFVSVRGQQKKIGVNTNKDYNEYMNKILYSTFA